VTTDIDVNSSLGQLQLLEAQRIEAESKQKQLETTKQRQSVILDAVQQKLMAVSLKPDQLNSQELGSLLRESHSKYRFVLCLLVISAVNFSLACQVHFDTWEIVTVLFSIILWHAICLD
jgi:23S rRNA pseudoU1915 N3-methylase RlmH